MADIVYDYYSVDAGIMIRLKDMLPYDIFKPAWDEIARLISIGQWKIFQNVASEVHGDSVQQWLAQHNHAIVKFNSSINAYMNSLMAELQKNGMTIVEPMSMKNNCDPFVVMLALYLEGRDLNDLRKKTSMKTCCVLTREELKEKKMNIPAVCKYYGLPYLTLFEFMKHHGWEITLNVHNP
jgi:hypothetical protein